MTEKESLVKLCVVISCLPQTATDIKKNVCQMKRISGHKKERQRARKTSKPN